MKRAEFIKATGLLAGGVILSPEILFAQEAWAFELLGKFAEAIIMDVFLKPIEDFIKDLTGMDDTKRDIQNRNASYRQQNMYPSSMYGLGNSSLLYPVKTPYNTNLGGSYDVPTYTMNNYTGSYQNIATFKKHEVDAVASAANILIKNHGAEKADNTKLFLPNQEISRNWDSNIRSAKYVNNEGGKIEVRHGISDKWGFVNVDSRSYVGQIPIIFTS